MDRINGVYKKGKKLSDILDSVEVEDTLEDRLLRDLPKGKPFSTRIICEYYNTNKNTLYPILQRFVEQGILTKSKGKFQNRNNVVIYTRC